MENKKTYSETEEKIIMDSNVPGLRYAHEMEKRRKAWEFSIGLSNVEKEYKPSADFQELIDKNIKGEITTKQMLKITIDKYKNMASEHKGKYKGYYFVSDCKFDLDFSKVRNIIRVEVDGKEDYEIFFDDDEFTVILSDIVCIIDDKDIKHTDDILEFLQSI